MILDASQVVLLTQSATQEATIFDGSILRFSTADSTHQAVATISEGIVNPQSLLRTQMSTQNSSIPTAKVLDDIRPPIGKTYKRNINRTAFLHKCQTCGKPFKSLVSCFIIFIYIQGNVLLNVMFAISI